MHISVLCCLLISGCFFASAASAQNLIFDGIEDAERHERTVVVIRGEERAEQGTPLELKAVIIGKHDCADTVYWVIDDTTFSMGVRRALLDEGKASLLLGEDDLRGIGNHVVECRVKCDGKIGAGRHMISVVPGGLTESYIKFENDDKIQTGSVFYFTAHAVGYPQATMSCSGCTEFSWDTEKSMYRAKAGEVEELVLTLLGIDEEGEKVPITEKLIILGE